MNKQELKKVLKPLIKECIKEVIFEDGTLSGIISEVAKGLSPQKSEPVVISNNTETSTSDNPAVKAARIQLEETKRSLQKSTGLQGIFEGTTPLTSRGSSQSAQYGALRDSDPSDPGVDISQFMFGGHTSK